ncbi:MAG: hypothetical protein ABIL76_03385 [candidate division WOR-3 bacterium]
MRLLAWSFILTPILIGIFLAPFGWFSLSKEENDNLYRYTGYFSILYILSLIILILYLLNPRSFSILIIISAVVTLIYIYFMARSLFRISDIYDKNIRYLAIALILCIILSFIHHIGSYIFYATIAIYILLGLRLLKLSKIKN